MSGIHEIKGASTLPTGAKERKECPIASGVLDYFPDAIAEIARVSFKGNEQHNPGTPLHWDRSKSTDEADALMRHFLERGKLDSDGQRHTAKIAWRALALLQKEIEAEQSPVFSGQPGSVVTYRRNPQRVCGAIVQWGDSHYTLDEGHPGPHFDKRTGLSVANTMAPRPGGAF